MLTFRGNGEIMEVYSLANQYMIIENKNKKGGLFLNGLMDMELRQVNVLFMSNKTNYKPAEREEKKKIRADLKDSRPWDKTKYSSPFPDLYICKPGRRFPR